MQKNQKEFQAGISLLEILVSLSLIGILLTAALPSYDAYIKKAQVGSTIEYLSGAITRATTELLTDGEATVPVPASQPMEFLQCVTVEVYRPSRTDDCTVVYIEAWPNTGFDPTVRLGTTRMLVYQGQLNTTSNQVDWRCGPFRNSSKSIDNTLLPTTCQDNIPQPSGPRCFSGSQKTLNTRCRLNR